MNSYMDELHRALSAKLSELRMAVPGLTQEQLASKSGVSRTTIANIENGRQSVTLEVLYRLSKPLERSAGDILNEAIRNAYPNENRSILPSDVDNKEEVLETLRRYIK